MWWTGDLSRFADHWQENPALVCGFTGKQFLYKDVNTLTKKFGSHLLENGFSPGDKIATIVPNCPEFGPVLLGSLGKTKIIFWVYVSKVEKSWIGSWCTAPKWKQGTFKSYLRLSAFIFTFIEFGENMLCNRA